MCPEGPPAPSPAGALAERLRAGEAVVAGVLSGTSADGVDVALARFAEEGGRLVLAETLAFAVEPFPAELEGRVRAVLDGASCGLRETALLHRDLGRAFGAAARAVARSAGVALELVGSHGQTVWHHDGEEASGPATLQLGDGDEVAEAAGCAVVSDFRARDVAAGGEGAPLSAYADDLVFGAVPRPFAVLNLGGMANVSWVGETELLAFDTGPCNSLLDGLARRFLDRPFDEGGEAALAGVRPAGAVGEPVGESAGESVGELLWEARSERGDRIRRWCGELSRNAFFTRGLPRSTGRDTFGSAWVDEAVAAGRRLGLEPVPDLFMGAARWIAAMVQLAASRFLPGDAREWIVAGGGARNRALLEALRVPLPGLRSSADSGVDPDAREALVFAGLAARQVLGQGVTRDATTGARPGRVLGKLSPAPPEEPENRSDGSRAARGR